VSEVASVHEDPIVVTESESDRVSDRLSDKVSDRADADKLPEEIVELVLNAELDQGPML
jgi:hypothetical protein